MLRTIGSVADHATQHRGRWAAGPCYCTTFTNCPGFGSVANDQPISAAYPYHNPDLPQTVYDPDQARALFKKAGVEGTTIPLYRSLAQEAPLSMARRADSARTPAKETACRSSSRPGWMLHVKAACLYPFLHGPKKIGSALTNSTLSQEGRRLRVGPLVVTDRAKDGEAHATHTELARRRHLPWPRPRPRLVGRHNFDNPRRQLPQRVRHPWVANRLLVQPLAVMVAEPPQHRIQLPELRPRRRQPNGPPPRVDGEVEQLSLKPSIGSTH